MTGSRGPEAPPSSVRVLVVDDNPWVAQALLRLLGAGFDGVTARDGEAARVLLAAGEEYEVILCDVVMPRRGGLALLRWVREERPHLVERFLFLTAEPELEEAREIGASHVHAVIQKPCTRAQLLEAVERVRGKP